MRIADKPDAWVLSVPGVQMFRLGRGDYPKWEAKARTLCCVRRPASLRKPAAGPHGREKV